MENIEQEHGKNQASGKMEDIRQMVDRLEHARECDRNDCKLSNVEILNGLNIYGESATEEQRELYHDVDDALQQISEFPLSLQFRSGWHNYGEEPKDAEFEIELCTGGPAVRIVGELDSEGEPCRAWLEYQDWEIPWTQYFGEKGDNEYVLEIASELIAK
jgi:hypothetical protein